MVRFIEIQKAPFTSKTFPVIFLLNRGFVGPCLPLPSF